MSVLFYFSLSLSNYEHRRQLSSRQRENLRNSSISNAQEDRESLISHQEPSSTSTFDPDDDKEAKMNGHVPNEVIVVKPKKNFLRSPLLYLNSLL